MASNGTPPVNGQVWQPDGRGGGSWVFDNNNDRDVYQRGPRSGGNRADNRFAGANWDLNAREWADLTPSQRENLLMAVDGRQPNSMVGISHLVPQGFQGITGATGRPMIRVDAGGTYAQMNRSQYSEWLRTGGDRREAEMAANGEAINAANQARRDAANREAGRAEALERMGPGAPTVQNLDLLGTNNNEVTRPLGFVNQFEQMFQETRAGRAAASGTGGGGGTFASPSGANMSAGELAGFDHSIFGTGRQFQNMHGGRLRHDNDGQFMNILASELAALEGIHAQNPETGAFSDQSFLSQYSNRLLGAPYQLLDSVDRRFPAINQWVGSEYLRNFLLHSPILYVRPGMPKYTGGRNPTGIFRAIQDAYTASNSDVDITAVQSLILSAATTSFFRQGARLQARMFGFRETYMEYMFYVNYMCRSVAVMIGLTETGPHPDGTFVSAGEGEMEWSEFKTMRWENYRMTDTYVNTVRQQWNDMLGATAGGAILNTVGAVGSFLNPFDGSFLSFRDLGDAVWDAWDTAANTTVFDVLNNKVTSVMFMVEPVSFQESLNNQTEKSFIEGIVDGITNSVGSEIAFITNSRALGIGGDLLNFLGSSVDNAVMRLNQLVSPVTGGFATNLFSGAIRALKGQKMIYPDIYKSSSSSMDYEFSMTLTSPYGDIYNYYMNVVVPLLHLIGIAAPRMVSSNTISSPFLVQAFIPGMCTCQLGIVSQMNIIKNPTTRHVSVHGFPLTVKVSFTIKELYNALAISPANDPASFLFNETLNDYLANMAGLIPSMDTLTMKRLNAMGNLGNYFTDGTIIDDLVAPWAHGFENLAGANNW